MSTFDSVQVLSLSCRFRFHRFALHAITCALFCLSLVTVAHAQKVLGGQINTYCKVLNVQACQITVESTGGLEPGQEFIIIQMGGAVVDANGVLTGMGMAGYWELHTAREIVDGNKILPNRFIGNPSYFDPSKYVQIVTLPKMDGMPGIISSDVVGSMWSSETGTGGVIAINSPFSLQVNANIDANGIGFGYGNSSRILPDGRSSIFCGQTAATVTEDAGFKGDGAAITGTQFGRGHWGTGGGGGMNHNAGGGGGGNFGVGGQGGKERQMFKCAPADNGGEGGDGFTDYKGGNPPFMMGGSGGSGHQNNGQGGDGGRGGGIIIIQTGRVNGGSAFIRANGDRGGDGINDGAGGGGAGGAILFYASFVSGTLQVEAAGGDGGNVIGDERVGPGGGGGGGVVLGRMGPAAARLTGGKAGIQTKFGNSTHFAAPGGTGLLKGALPLSIPMQGGSNALGFDILPKNIDTITFCEGGSFTLSAGNPSSPDINLDETVWTNTANPRFSKTGKSITVTESGTYVAEVTVGECVTFKAQKVVVWPNPLYGFGGAEWLPPCGVERFRMGDDIGATRGTPPYQYLWETDDPESINPDDVHNQTIWAEPKKDTKYKITVTDGHGCIFTNEFTYKFAPPIIYHAPDTNTCSGTDVRIGVERQGGTAPFEFVWTPATGLDNPGIARPTVIAPTANQRYIVRITDYNGCRIFDTILVTVKPLPVTSISANTVVCPGAGAQLTATGGKTYAWSPGTGLSCTTCPNPTARPAATTTYSVLITDAKGCSRTETVTVTVRTPRIAASVRSLDFGKLEGCSASATQEFFLRNNDDADIDINDPLFSAAGFTVIDPPLPTTIKGRDSVRIVVRFSPTASGVSTARLTLSGLCGASDSIDLSGEQPTTAVSASLGVINFGQTLSCDVAPRDSVFVVTNTGTAPLDFAAPIIAPPFQVLYPLVPPSLQPGDTAHIVVRFAPAAAGSFALDLALPYVAGACQDTLRVALNGSNLRPSATIDHDAITFAELVGCNLSSDTVITLTNTSTAPISLAGSITPGFRIMSTVPASLDPGSSTAVTIRFEPVAQGAANGTFILIYGACHDTLRVTLTGSSQGVSFAMTDSVNFGEVISCVEQSKSMPFTITNTSAGSAGGSVTDVFTTGPFTTTLLKDQALPNNVPGQFTVTYTPTADGDASGTIEITMEPCNVRRTIYLSGRGSTATLAVVGPTTVSFGAVPITQTRTQTMRFRNTGSATINLVTLAGITPPFAVISTTPSLPATLAPGEELAVDVTYTGTGGTQNMVLQAVSEDPCILSAEVQVNGGGDVATTSVALPDFAAAPGQRVVVPILATGTADLPSVGVTDFTATVRFRRTLLIVVPQAAPAVTSDDLAVDASDPEYMLYRFTSPFRAGDTLAKLAFIAALGDAQQTPVTITSFAWSSPSVSVAITNGTFTLEEVCVTGATRLISGDGNFGLKPVRPNPVSTTMEIEYELVENGQTELFVTNLQGERVAVLMSGEGKPGRYVVTVDARNLSSGSYLYTLRTPTQQVTRRMDVVK